MVKNNFWPGISFTALDELNRQALAWGERRNSRVHRTTHERPVDRWKQEPLAPLPQAFAWDRKALEERTVGWEGDLSYDGGVTGLPAQPAMAGSVVQVRERHGMLSVWARGQLLVELAKRAGSGQMVDHPDQLRHVPPAAARRASVVPLGHWRPAPQVMTRALAEDDQLSGVEVASCSPS